MSVSWQLETVLEVAAKNELGLVKFKKSAVDCPPTEPPPAPVLLSVTGSVVVVVVIMTLV